MSKRVRSVESEISALQRGAFWGLTSKFEVYTLVLMYTKKNRKIEPQEFEIF